MGSPNPVLAKAGAKAIEECLALRAINDPTEREKAMRRFDDEAMAWIDQWNMPIGATRHGERQ
jgi:hypothetical protein